MGISIWQLLIILAIVLVLFGAKRLRTLGTDLGGAVKGFRTAMHEGEQEDDEDKDKDKDKDKEGEGTAGQIEGGSREDDHTFEGEATRQEESNRR